MQPPLAPLIFGRGSTQLTGATLDPRAELAVRLQGYHNGGPLIGTIGLFKGVLGLIARPTAGLLEWVGKGTHGVGLICLGREAITGSAQRRMRAPGALSDEPAEVGVAMDLPGSGAGGLGSVFSAQRHMRAPRALSNEPAEVGGCMQCIQVGCPDLVMSAQRRMRALVLSLLRYGGFRVQGSRSGCHESAWKRGWRPRRGSMGSHVARRGVRGLDTEALPGWCGGSGGLCSAVPGSLSVGLGGVLELLPAGYGKGQAAERHGRGACMGRHSGWEQCYEAGRSSHVGP